MFYRNYEDILSSKFVRGYNKSILCQNDDKCDVLEKIE